MKAIVVVEGGVAYQDVEEPKPGTDQVLVKVRAAALNRADLMVASGASHGAAGGAGTVVGMEWAGDVVEAGANVTHVKPGDRVMCSGGGGYAEMAVADYGRVQKIPDANVSYETASTLSIALYTMHNAIVSRGRLAKSEAILIQGASSGVGLMGMQIAKYMGAGLVIGSSTNAERRAKLSDFGADLAIDSSDPSWPDQVKKATADKGVDLIVDQISGPVVNDNMKAAAVLGRIVNVGRLGGGKVEFDCELHAVRRIEYIGVTFRTRSLEEVREIGRLMRADLWDGVAAGELSLPIDRTLHLSEAAEALAHMKANNHFGKIVLTT
ncbi:MAG: quinone oxidoreductase family protein [Hyphomicrobiaceae bacterium]